MIKYRIYIEYLNGHSEIVEFTTDSLDKTMEQYSRNRDHFKWSVIGVGGKSLLSKDNSKDISNTQSERNLLSKMYECQELMEDLLNDGKNDSHYELMSILIKRLEDHLKNNQSII
jgi:hypothetical protein